MEVQFAYRFIEVYGLPGFMVLGMALALRKIFNLYTASLEARATDGKELAAVMERNTSALVALKEVIKERK